MPGAGGRGKASVNTTHYYLTDLWVLAGHIRSHWGIENGLHWELDVAFRADDNRPRAGHARTNPRMARRIAGSLLKRVGRRRASRRDGRKRPGTTTTGSKSYRESRPKIVR